MLRSRFGYPAFRPGQALAHTKQQFYQLDGLSLEEGIRLGAKVNAIARATPDFRRAISAFLKK
jgi:enoyl-CoA hydratase/carnithine racemase